MNREEILILAEQCMPGIDEFYTPDVIKKFAKEIAKIENEECAKLAEEVGLHKNEYGIANAIRERGQE